MMQTPKRDFGTLRTQEIAKAGMAKLVAARSQRQKIETVADIILETFDDYYDRSRAIPKCAKRAFEARDWPRAIELSQERIAIYSVSIAKIAPILKRAMDEGEQVDGYWDGVEAQFRKLVKDRYEEDLALAYLDSLRRRLYRSTWQPERSGTRKNPAANNSFVRRFACQNIMTAELVKKILAVPQINATYRDLAGDAAAVAQRINEELKISDARPLEQVEVIDAGFYRNRGAYIIGAITVGGQRSPLSLALLHRPQGIEVDAVILRQATLSHVFSSTLANFHVTMLEYHDLVDYLFELMPARPRGQHYSTVGYNHVGKIAIMQQITQGLANNGEQLNHAPGPRGSVAMGFTSPSTPFMLKVIRDKPTDQYKWDHYGGTQSVLAKYRSVHELNRSGSMLDNTMYSDLTLPREIFDNAFLDEMLTGASGTVSLQGNSVFFKHLIVQRKLVPLPLYLQNCTQREAEMVVIRLGQCIRNNAATNVFNKDLDGRNYGVSSLRFVYLFDFDAIELLTDVKVRTNTDREPGEEDIPDWFFEEGIIFLPEELEMHLQLPSRPLIRLFREAHGELSTVAYWTRMQNWLSEGRVPRVRTYPRATQLRLAGADGNLVLSSPQSDSSS